MKVLSVIHFPEYGGPHNQSVQLAGPLASVDIESVTVLPPGSGSDRIEKAGARVLRLEMGRIRATRDPRLQLRQSAMLPRDVRNLRRLFIAERPDLVQLNGLINPHAAIAARSLGIPVVWQILDTRPPVRVRKVMAPLVSRLADVVMPIGNAVLDAHPGMDLGRERTVVFYPPINTDQIQPGPSDLRQELGIDASAAIIGCVANINPQKGYEYFVDAAAQVKNTHPRVKFVVVGRIYSDHPAHGPYFQSIRDRATGIGLIPGSDIFFLGARDDIANVIAAFNIFALASVPNSEGTPTVILEAMACAKPVITSNVGAVREVVADAKTGFVVPSLQPTIMAERMSRLLDDPALAREMGVNGRTRVEQEFGIDRCVAAHVNAYRLATAHRRANPCDQL